MPAGLKAGVAYVELDPRLAKDFERQVSAQVGDPLDREAKNAGSKFGGVFGKVAIAAGGLLAAKVGVDFFKGAISGASDLNETISKSNTIFGEAAPAIEKWANGADKAIGQSKQQALDAAGTFGNLFVQLGIGTEAAAGMSTSMVELASDFASFHNADVSEVIGAQTAAFRGEYDALQRFLPLINGATVEQRALEMSGKATTKELTAQEKALAVQALMLEGAGAAAGDFARTSDGLANKQRIAAAQMENLKTKVGNALLPAMTAATGFLSDRMLPALESAGRFLGDVAGKVSLFWNALTTGFTEDEGTPIEAIALTLRDTVLPILKTVAEFIGTHWKAIGAVLAAAVVGAAVAFQAMAASAAAAVVPVTAVAVSTGVALAPVIAIGAAIAATAAGLIYAYTHFETFRVIVDQVAAFVTAAATAFVDYVVKAFGDLVTWTRTHWAAFREAIQHVVNVVSGVIRTFVDVISALWRAWGDDLLRVAKTAFEFIRSTIENAIKFVRSIIETVLALINGDWGKAWEGIKGILDAVWSQIRNIVTTAINIVRSTIAGVLSTIGVVWSGAWDNVKGGLSDAWEAIKRTVSGGIDAVVGFVTAIPGRIAAVARGAFDTISDGFRGALNTIIRGWNRLEFRVPGFKVGPIGYDGFTLGLPDVPLLEAGGTFTGLAITGEGGPELVHRAGLSTVRTNSDLAAMLATAVEEVGLGTVDDDDESIGDLLDELRALRSDLRSELRRLGDVQLDLARTM